MIRLLTATLLVASFSVVADTEVPHTFEDGTPAMASEVNANFDALEAAIDAMPEGPAGPKGDTGDQGPAGADGRDAVGGFSHSWTFNAGNGGYGQFTTGGFVARTSSDYLSSKNSVTELWINLKDSESNTIGAGPSTAGGVNAYGFFSAFDAGDLVSLKHIEDSGDSVIYRLTAKPQWQYVPAYSSYVVLSVDTNSVAITGSSDFTEGSTYAIDFTKNGLLSGLSCSTDQTIVYRDGAWVCASAEYVSSELIGGYSGSVSCPTGKKVTGGGCYSSGNDGGASCSVVVSRPLSDLSGWECNSGPCDVLYAYAICQ